MSSLKNKFSSLFGKKDSASKSTRKNFRTQVQLFWEEFEKEEANIRKMMLDKVDPNMLIAKVSETLKTAFEDIPFEMGINDENKHELIFSPNGNRMLLMQIMYLLKYRPKHLDKLWVRHEVA